MDKVLRFSDYDVFAYIAAGLAAMLVCDFLIGSHWIIGANWGVSEGVAVVFGAYIAGHIVAWPAGWLIERILVGRILGRPSAVLLTDAKVSRISTWKRWLFPDYFTPLDDGLRARAKAKAGTSNDLPDSFFWMAFADAKRDAATYARMETFLRLYGFCRNIAFVGLTGGLLSIVAVLIGGARGMTLPTDRSLLWSLALLAGGAAALYRFLKFYRLYAVEVFVGYAATSQKEKSAANAD